jgi:Lrp/AsnC family transcriptional regulator of lysine biosynthesis
MKLDAQDERIIRMLKADARVSNVAMARAVGITEGAVRWRVRKLMESGTIRRFTVEVSTQAGSSAILMVKAKAETKKMMASIAALGLHRDAYEISGEYDACVILDGDSVEDIDRKIDRIRKLGEVAETRTYVSFGRY